MEILFTLAGFRSVGQRSGKCPLFASLRGLQRALSLTDGSFNVTTERSPTVSAMDQDTIKQLLVQPCFYPVLFLFVSQDFFLSFCFLSSCPQLALLLVEN